MTEAWGWDDVTGDWLEDVGTPVPAPVDIPVPRDGSLADAGLAPSDVPATPEP